MTNRSNAKKDTSMKVSPQRRILKSVVLLSTFICGFTSAGGVGVIVALALLGLWLFLDIQDSNRVSSVDL